jgi:membrane associated rhomboid family serine protease
MYTCPDCSQGLIQKKTEYGVFWVCEACGRCLIGIPFLRRTLEPVFFNRFWQEVLRSAPGQGTACPACAKPLNPISLGIPDPLALVCKVCNFAWLTTEQRSSLPIQTKPETSANKALAPEAAQLAAMMQVQMMAERARDEGKFDGSRFPLWQKALCVVGMPLEGDALEFQQPPLCTFLLSLSMLAVSVGFLITDPKAAGLGFVPAEPGRYGGLTFFSNFLVHSGWFQMFSDLYFLFLFGRGVEAKVRWYGLLALVLFSTLAGNLAALVLAPNLITPVFGSGGGIAGILLFYGFVYPHQRLVFYFFRRFIPVPVWAVLGVWVFFQLLGVFMQSSAAGEVSYVCNFGGLFAGLLGWLFWRWRGGSGDKKDEGQA